MRLYIVRHGETEENRLRICQGQTHGTLTAEGIEEANLIGRRLAHIPIDICYTSDLHRAYRTAEIISSKHSTVIPVITDSRLRERYFGSYQGQVFPTESHTDHFFFSEAETPHLIACRLLSLLHDLIARHAHHSVLLVSHGFTIRVLLALLTGRDADDWTELPELLNTSLSIVDGPEPFTLVLLNDTSHLGGRF